MSQIFILNLSCVNAFLILFVAFVIGVFHFIKNKKNFTLKNDNFFEYESDLGVYISTISIFIFLIYFFFKCDILPKTINTIIQILCNL